MKQIIKNFLQKYTDPKLRVSGVSVDELAEMLEEELKPKKIRTNRLDSVDGLIAKGLEYADKKTKEEKAEEELKNAFRECERAIDKAFEVRRIHFNDRPFNWDAVDEEYEHYCDETEDQARRWGER